MHQPLPTPRRTDTMHGVPTAHNASYGRTGGVSVPT